jgi:Cu/Ag efflux protein CusF
MKKEVRFFLAAVSSLILIAAVWGAPPATRNTNVAVQAAAAQTQSASGTISAVDKSTFTITLPPMPNASMASVVQQDPPKSMTFVVDKNTTIEGKLRVGANADVTYRDDNGSHVAIGVRVTPPQS